MASVIRITESEVLSALADAIGHGETDAQTVEDLMDSTGLSRQSVRRALHHYQKQGRLAVHKVLRPAIDGRQCYRPGYTILPVKKRK